MFVETYCLSDIGDRGRLPLGVKRFEVRADYGPLNALEKVVEVCVLVSTVLLQIGVLPEVDAEDGNALDVNHTVHQRIVFVVRLSDDEATIGAHTQPHPAGQCSPLNSPAEGFLKAVEISEILRDRVRQGANWSVLCVVNRLAELTKQEQVIVDAADGESLRRLVESCCLHVVCKFSANEVLILLHNQLFAITAHLLCLPAPLSLPRLYTPATQR